MRPSHELLLLLVVSTVAFAGENTYEFGGHSKLTLLAQSYPDDSLFRELAGARSLDAAEELRLNFSAKNDRWSLHADYQLIALRSDFLPFGLPQDDNRLFDLTTTLDDGDGNAILHRLDRFWVGYTGEKTVLRFGRQALSWGNGLIYAPMDLVNPFDPTTIDTEYKTGDDMLYMQYLRDNGDDIQATVVFRRNVTSGVAGSNEATIALKYHGFAGENEYDVLVAQNYDNTVVGIGYARSVGGAIWRGDIVVTDSSGDIITEVVSNLSYSWIWGGRNMGGAVEYYYNGFDRHYVAGSLAIEMSPLWMLTPTVLTNANDPSGLLLLITQYSLSDNMTFLGSLNIPLGANGTEFGGPESGIPGRYLSMDAGVFAQFAWYF
ncbi:MAG: hypothetical protein GWP02_04075 [Desulfobulbaceae bacterium]|nr:hypothetical protein [Desulfobulbaceae bacterium]